MIQTKTLDKYFFLWAPPPLSPTPFYRLSFFVVFFLLYFLVVFFSYIFFLFFNVFFSLFFFVFFSIHVGTFLTTIVLQFSEIYIIGVLVALFLFFYLSAGSEREKSNAMR